MRVLALTVAVLTSFTLPASAAPREDRATTRYFLLSGTFVGEVETDASLKEIRQGANVTSATIDVCYGSATAANRRDRFVVDLVPGADKLSGTGKSQVRGEPISVQLIRKPEGDKVTFEGAIKVGAETFEVTSPENNDISEAEFREGQTIEEFIFSAPSMFAESSPGTVGVRVRLEALPSLVKALKSENARIRVDTLQTDCPALRGGNQVVQMEVDPMRSAALVDKLKSLPGVVRAGWTAGNYSLENAVRLPRADYGGANLDRDRLVAAVAGSIAKAWEATLDTTARDDITGEIVVRSKRPSQAYAAFGLTETISLPVLIGPEKPGSTEAIVVWLGVPSLDTIDEGADPRLKFVRMPEGQPGSESLDTAPLQAAIARDLNGRVWDADAGAWK